MRLLPLFPLFSILQRKSRCIPAPQLVRTNDPTAFSLLPERFDRLGPCLAQLFATQRENAGYSGFGCAAIVSRNVFTLLLSMIAVPVSTKVGIGAVGAVRQSLNSCTALWCRSSANLIA